MGLSVRGALGEDLQWVAASMRDQWGTIEIVSRGRLVDAMTLPALVCVDGEDRLGLAVYEVTGGQCEVVALRSPVAGRGAGSVLLEAVSVEARRRGCVRMWLITTNDNLSALRFYQRWGMRVVAVHAGAMDETRRLKPEVPEIGLDGIPLRDEIELEMPL